MTHLTAAEEAALNLSPRAKLEILGAILLALFLFALDQTVVGHGAAADRHRPAAATTCTPGSSRSTC